MKYKYFLLGALLIISFILIVFLYQNYYHNQAKNNVLRLIQQQIDSNSMEASFRTNMYELNKNYYVGRIYVVSNIEDLEFVKNILKNCKPVHKEINFKPTDIHVFIGNVDIGYAGVSSYYYWPVPGINNKDVGFELPRKYDDKLWRFLESLEYVENSAN